MRLVPLVSRFVGAARARLARARNVGRGGERPRFVSACGLRLRARWWQGLCGLWERGLRYASQTRIAAKYTIERK